jgi:hypothetical protein
VFVATVAKQKEKENFGGKNSSELVANSCVLIKHNSLSETSFCCWVLCHTSHVRTFIFSALKNKYFGMVLNEKTQNMILSTKVTFSLKKLDSKTSS